MFAVLGLFPSQAGTLVYDDSGRLLSSQVSESLAVNYSTDPAGNVTSVTVDSLDATDNGIPDWWEFHYFGQIGIDPFQRGKGGVQHLTAFALGISPLDPSLDDLPTMLMAQGGMRFRFQRSEWARHLRFVVQQSGNLQSWTNLEQETQAALLNGPIGGSLDGELKLYELFLPETRPRAFLRLLISAP